MVDLKLGSLLFQNRQLANHHQQIMELYHNYKYLQNQYQKTIKQQLKQLVFTVRKIEKQNVSSKMHQQQLRFSLAKDSQEHSKLDQNFNKIFMDSYLGNSLNQLIESEVLIDKELKKLGLSADQIDQDKCLSIKNIQRTHFLENHRQNFETELNRMSPYKLQLDKQIQKNRHLIKEIQGLQVQYSNLHQTWQSFSAKISKQSQIQKNSEEKSPILTQRNSEQIYQNQSKSQNDQISIFNDQELFAQLECLEKLIKTKNQIIAELENCKNTLTIKIHDRKAKQLYLAKKKDHLEQIQRPKLEKDLDKIVQIVKSNQKTSDTRLLKENNQLNSNQSTQKLATALCQVSLVKTIISNQFANFIFQQKKKNIENKQQ